MEIFSLLKCILTSRSWLDCPESHEEEAMVDDFNLEKGRKINHFYSSS